MAFRSQLTTDQGHKSAQSAVFLWDKLREIKPVPNRTIDDDDLNDENNSIEYESIDDASTPSRYPLRRSGSAANISASEQNTSLWVLQDYDEIKLIVLREHVEEAKIEVTKILSNQNIQSIPNEGEQSHSWYFGLIFIRFHLERVYRIDIARIVPMQPSTFWLGFKNKTQQQKQQQQRVRLEFEHVKPFRYGNVASYQVSLRYGALTKLNEFSYSAQHSWSNRSYTKISVAIDRFGGVIEWLIEESGRKQKKQLLVDNIDQTVIIQPFSNGFAAYICQKCNMNELHATERPPNVVRTEDVRLNSPRQDFLVRPSFASHRSASQPVYDTFKRIGIRNGTYFSTVQFELRIHSDRIGDEKVKQIVRKTYSELTKFFTLHNIRMCYGTIESHPGPSIRSLSIPKSLPLVIKYSWQMLLDVGYRLQVQVQLDDQFREDILALSRSESNVEDLFYRVCVYLWRLFTLEPFVNLSEKLHDAVLESKRKQENNSFGLISSLQCTSNTEAYLPSVRITPTSVRIKPLKLCRTNRVLRAESKFGKPLEHFAIVDIRDENGERLRSMHFQNLHSLFLDYLNNGFTLMDDNRFYRYLHHSQSQLRSGQFWFYHHESGLNCSFDDAYKWMGVFDREKNVAKYSSRMALCFSTTIPTIDVNEEFVQYTPDIKTTDGRLKFTDGCGTMSKQLRDDIAKQLGRGFFSAVQFRYAGAKGVVSVNQQLGPGYRLCIRESMDKFDSEHRCFEVCKVSAPRPLYLNRQAILLLSNRQIPDSVFLRLQQRNHLTLIRALLRNTDAHYLLDEKLPYWFLPEGANIDFIHEPFFQQVLINACLNSVRELLRRTRIRVPANTARNMFGIIDEYNVLKPDEVFIQYTPLNDHEDEGEYNERQKTRIIENTKVVITKNPCHHPGDVRTFTAVNHEALKHLKDVIVFSQQGDCPAPHQISGSDLDGDEYAVIWHNDLVPLQTSNAEPYDYSSHKESKILERPIERKDIHDVVLEIAESDFLGRLSNLHLAYADRFGVASNEKPRPNVLSTIQLAGAISEEVDSGKTGQHPLSHIEINNQAKALENKRPDFMENKKMKSYRSPNTLGKLYRASRKTLLGWNQLLRRHRHLRHLEIRTPENDNDEEEKEKRDANINGNQTSAITLDTSLVNITPSILDSEISVFASQLFYVYRQEMLEILNLYELSHESDLWCRQTRNSVSGEFEDTAYTQLEQLVMRTRDAVFYYLVSYCPQNSSRCNRNTAFENLCGECQDLLHRTTVALYKISHSIQNDLERAPILSLPWLFTTALLKTRHRELQPTQDFLSIAMQHSLESLTYNKSLQLGGLNLKFSTSNNDNLQASVDWTVCVFVEVLHYYIKQKAFKLWPRILSKFIRETESFKCKSSSKEPDRTIDDWRLLFNDEGHNDIYAGILISMEWTEDVNKRMHTYFDQILNICFELSYTSMADDNNNYLEVSEQVILILQRIAIGETFDLK